MAAIAKQTRLFILIANVKMSGGRRRSAPMAGYAICSLLQRLTGNIANFLGALGRSGEKRNALKLWAKGRNQFLGLSYDRSDEVVLPRFVFARQHSTDIRRKRRTNSSQCRSEDLRNRPIGILNPLQESICARFDRRPPCLDCSVRGGKIELVAWHDRSFRMHNVGVQRPSQRSWRRSAATEG